MGLRLRLLLQLILIFAVNHATAFPDIASVNKQPSQAVNPQTATSSTEALRSDETSKLSDQGQFVSKLDDSNLVSSQATSDEMSTQTTEFVEVEEATTVFQTSVDSSEHNNSTNSTNSNDESDSNPPVLRQFLWVSSQSTKPPELPNRIQDVKPPQKPTNSPSISLEYKPNRPSFHPNPGNNIGQIVPPGKPWPASLEEYAGFSQTSTSKPPAWAQTQNNGIPELPSRVQEVAATPPTKKPISLEYQPMRPSFHPNPDSAAQIVPPGKPWPASLEEYAGFSQTSTSKPPAWVQTQNNGIPELPSRIQEVAATPTTNKPIRPSQDVVKPLIVAGYKPILPSYKPHPGNPSSQIIPPGKPWPASPEGYNDFRPPSLKPQIKLPELPDQIQEVAPTDPKPAVPELVNRFQEISKEPTYKPSGPVYGPFWPYVDDYEEFEYSSVNSLLLELLIGKSIADIGDKRETSKDEIVTPVLDIGDKREKSKDEIVTPVLYTSKVAKTENVS